MEIYARRTPQRANISLKTRKGAPFKSRSTSGKKSFFQRPPSARRPHPPSGAAEVPPQAPSPGLLPPHELARIAAASRDELALLQQQSIALQAQQREAGSTMHALDNWQREAIAALHSGTNVVVDAPTTAGKTRVVEAFFAAQINNPAFRACYTCPVKSLSNDKFKEFRQLFGADKVGISTGDYRENLQAPIVVATLETYRNSLLGVEPDFGRHLVVFDEYHFLQDSSRGSSWEEAIILTPSHCQMLLLSASLGNAEDFVQWIETISGRPTALIAIHDRPVPLVNLVWESKKWLVANLLPKALLNQRRPAFPAMSGPQMIERIAGLKPLGLTPCLVYAGKRKNCEHIAEALVHSLPPLSTAERVELQKTVAAIDSELQVLALCDSDLTSMLFSHGIVYHHSGLMPPVRLLIERLIKDGSLHYCVATMGLSLGINFAVKSTVISDFTRPGEAGFVPYSTSEVLQMTGRAGRRGRDVVGFSCWLSFFAYRKLLPTARENCSSNLRSDPSTILGLYSRGYPLPQVEKFYNQSFLKFSRPNADLSLVHPQWLRAQLHGATLPCRSPASEYMSYHDKHNALCYDCPLIKNCHRAIQQLRKSSSLAAMHLHLHHIGTINNDELLNETGEWARFFPQNGGLLIASMVAQGEITSENLPTALQLMAALSLAHYKTNRSAVVVYKFPFSIMRVRRDLEIMYPRELFPDFYELPKGMRKSVYIFKDFNPSAGLVIKLWVEGASWDELRLKTSGLELSEGDISGLIYRCASYLQSLSQAQKGDISEHASELRQFILRPPVNPTF
jgi:hypothetical protein